MAIVRKVKWRSDYTIETNKDKKLYYSYIADKENLDAVYSDYIHKHPQESQLRHNERKDRAVVLATMQYFVDTYINAVFSNEIDYNSEKADIKYTRFLESATPDGTTFEEILRNIGTYTQFLDCVVLIDSFTDQYKLELGIENPRMPKVVDVEKYRLWSYISVIMPWDIVNYELDIYGNIKQLLIRRTILDQSDNFESETQKTYFYYFSPQTIWVGESKDTKDDLIIKNIGSSKVEIIEEYENTLGYVPALYIEATNREKYLNIAANQRSIANVYSTMELKGLNSAFSLLATEGLRYTNDNESRKNQIYGDSDNVNQLEYEEKPPFLLERKADDIPNLQQLIKEMYHVDQFQFWLDITDESSMFAMSGKAMEIGRKSLSEALKKTSEKIENIANKILDMYADIEGYNAVNIIMPSRFDIETMAEKIDNLERALLIYRSDSVYAKYLLETGVDVISPDLQLSEPKRYKEIIDDIQSQKSLRNNTLSINGQSATEPAEEETTQE